MKPRFEEHDNQLFRMLDKPTPLTPDAKMPCLVRLIQDDSPMGRMNKRAYPIDKISPIIVIDLETSGEISTIGNVNTHLEHESFEIIGYPVIESSKDWALYQMMQGLKVCNPQLAKDKAARLGCDDEIFNTYWYVVGDAVVEGKGDYGTLSVSSWIAAASSTGWQIYNESESQYKVSDWVDCKDLVGVHAQCKVLEIHKHNVILECKTGHRWSLPHNNIIRKLSSSEIVLDFGSGIKGWIRRASNHTIEVYSKANCWLANIRYDMLDTETRKLVESLLKVQKEEK